MLRQAEDAWRSLLDFLQSQKESVDHGVARNQNLPGRNSLFQEVLARVLRRRKVQSRKPRGQRAIGFLRPGRLKVPTSEARLNVANGYLQIESRERGAQHGRRVALHENQIRPLRSQVTIQSLQGPGGQAGQGLAWPH